jgi:predicted transcriptional regulator
MTDNPSSWGNYVTADTKARTMRDKGINATDIAKMLGVSRATVYRYLSLHGAELSP